MKKDDAGPPAHDDREIDARTIVRLAVGLSIVVVLALGGAWLVTGWSSSNERASYPKPPPIAAAGPTAPPEPRLEPSPPINLAALRAEEDEILGRYAWVDRPSGVVAIPIDRAIELTLERGLPVRKAPFPASTVTVPSQSSLRERKADSP